jgi:hypothetical protein
MGSLGLSISFVGKLSNMIYAWLFNMYLISKGMEFIEHNIYNPHPKEGNARTTSDFRPISLMHSVARILSKIMSKRLVQHLPIMGLHC